jgi:hypothetical protein
LFVGCEQPAAKTLSSNPALTEITVAGVPATLGSPSNNWEAPESGTVFLTPAQAASAEILVTKANSDSTVYYAKVNAANTVPVFEEESTFAFEPGDQLYIESFSANHDLVFYYKVDIVIASNATLKSVALRRGGTASQVVDALGDRFASLGTPGTAWNTAVAGEVITRSNLLTNVFVVAIPVFPSSTVRYAYTPNGTAAPAFSANAIMPAIAAGGFIYLEVTSLDTATRQIYKIEVKINNNKTDLNDITIGGKSVQTELGSLGTKGEVYGQQNIGYGAVAAIAPSGVVKVDNLSALTNPVITVTPPAGVILGRDITVKYAWGFGNSTLTTAVDWADSITGTVPKGSYIGVQITASDGAKGYYKFLVSQGRSTTPNITSLTLDGETVSLGTANATFSAANSGSGTITLSTPAKGLAGSPLVAVLSDPTAGAKVEYGFPFNSYGWQAPPLWKEGSTLINFNLSGSERIAARVIAEDGITVLYYVFTVAR